MALNTKISFYISRKNKLTLSPVSSSIIPNILLLSSGKKAERNLKLIAQRLTTRLTRHSLTIIDQGGKRGRGNPKEAERNSNAECIEMTRRNSEQCCSRFVLNRADTRQRSKTRTEAEVNAAYVQVCFVRFWIFDKRESKIIASRTSIFCQWKNKNGRRRDQQRHASSISLLFSTILFGYPFRRHSLSLFTITFLSLLR